MNAADPIGSALACAAGPLAAFVAGCLQASSAATRRPWAGIVMGAETYLLGIVFGVVGFFLVEPLVHGGAGVGIGDVVTSAVFFPVIGVFVLAPLLVLCVASGIAWALAMRAVVDDAPTGTSRPGRAGSGFGWFLLAGTGLLLLMWFVAFSTFSGLGGEFID